MSYGMRMRRGADICDVPSCVFLVPFLPFLYGCISCLVICSCMVAQLYAVVWLLSYMQLHGCLVICSCVVAFSYMQLHGWETVNEK